MKLEKLLNKYFEGETSSEEEKEIRDYFRSGQTPPHLEMYRPLFTYFDQESKVIEKVLPAKRRIKKPVIYFLSGIAASFLILLGVTFYGKTGDSCLCEENYVMISGKCITDTEIILSHVFVALQEVATPVEEYFPFPEKDGFEQHIIENQLKELGSIFSDDE